MTFLAFRLLAIALSLGPARAMRVSTASRGAWNQPPHASVYAEKKEAFPKNATQAVELLRFVTAYRKGLEALVDITPYSALLRAAADADGELSFYSFIDTWVGNTSSTPVLYHTSDKCVLTSAWGEFNGNGWDLEADLVFWPRTGSVDTRPRETMTIASGHYGAYGMGGISVHEGTVAENGKRLILDEPADINGLVQADLHVYRCPGGASDVHTAELRAHIAKKAEILMKNHRGKDMDALIKQLGQDLVQDQMSKVVVKSTDVARRRIEAAFDPKKMRIGVGMPVFVEGSNIIETRDGFNASFPMADPIGKVIAVNTEASSMTVEMKLPCLPSEATLGLPHLRIPNYPGFMEDATNLAESIREVHVAEHQSEASAPLVADIVSHMKMPAEEAVAHAKVFARDFHANHPIHLTENSHLHFRPALIAAQNGSFAQMQELAATTPPMQSSLMSYMLLQESTQVKHHKGESKQDQLAGGQPLADGDRACALLRRETGRLFRRDFPMETLKSTDRVLLQWAVTGHGWSGSTDSCGEFCHATYRVRFNGKSAANVTEWRNDCNQNPVSNQAGTWELARNGWCPGSVKPGLYMDVTQFVSQGMNDMTVDLVVYSQKTGKYEPYTDYGGFYGGDTATSFMGITLFVYDVEAADAIKAQRKALTAAERALREGCNHPSALEDPSIRLSQPSDSLVQTGSAINELRPSLRTSGRTQSLLQRKTTKPAEGYDFEKTTPWYDYDEAKVGLPVGVTKVRAVRDALMQSSSREVRMKVKKSELPQEWGQVGLLLRLKDPPEGSMDFWDRVGSVGMLLKDTSKHMQLHPANTTVATQKLRPEWIPCRAGSAACCNPHIKNQICPGSFSPCQECGGGSACECDSAK